MGRILLALVLAGAVGCSSSDSTSVPERCSQTGESVCETNSNCAVETGLVSASEQSDFVANCVAGFKRSLDCSRQTRSTGNPDACDSDLAATPCAQFEAATGLPIPASCRSIYAE